MPSVVAVSDLPPLPPEALSFAGGRAAAAGSLLVVSAFFVVVIFRP
jgi:hypothetical protein